MVTGEAPTKVILQRSLEERRDKACNWGKSMSQAKGRTHAQPLRLSVNHTRRREGDEDSLGKVNSRCLLRLLNGEAT